MSADPPSSRTGRDRLTGRVAVVTGSSRGIGLAIVRRLHAEGASVVVNGRNAHAVAEAAQPLGQRAIGVAADVSTEAGAKRLIAAAAAEFGSVDILVNNAGIASVESAERISARQWRRVIDLNLTGAFLCSQQAARRMLIGRGGTIVNVASITSFVAFPKRVAYAVSKAGLVMMTKVMAIEWAPKIRVVALAPGYTKTEMMEELFRLGKADLASLERRTPMGRLVSVEEVADAALFLASDEASFITGETLVVDGGWLAYGYV